MAYAVEPRILEGANPFDVQPDDELIAVPPAGVEGWSETVFFSVWSPIEQVGIMIHAGTAPQDTGLWWAQVFAYLPGDSLVVDRSWGRPMDRSGPSTGNLEVTCTEPLHRWRLRFDGAGETTTTGLLATRTVGAGSAVPLRFDIELEAAGPVWDLYRALEIPTVEWGSLHHEQNLLARGSLEVDGQRWPIDGVSFRDHSSGARTFAGVAGDHFWGLVSPSTRRSIQGLTVWDRSGEVALQTGSIFDDGVLEISPHVTMTGITDTAGSPSQLEMTFQRSTGEKLVVPGRQLHCGTFSIVDPNSNINGTVLDGDPLILAESPVRFDWPDGDVFYGHVERSWRLSGLTVFGSDPVP